MTTVYVATKAHPWDSDTATTDPGRAELGSPPIGEIAPIAEDSGATISARRASLAARTPSRWLSRPCASLGRAPAPPPTNPRDRLMASLRQSMSERMAEIYALPADVFRTLFARTALAAIVEPLGDCPRCGKPKRLCRRAKGIAPTCGARFARA